MALIETWPLFDCNARDYGYHNLATVYAICEIIKKTEEALQK